MTRPRSTEDRFFIRICIGLALFVLFCGTAILVLRDLDARGALDDFDSTPMAREALRHHLEGGGQ